MTTTTTTFSVDHPAAFLNELFSIDEIAAVRVADKWGDINSATFEQYLAAWEIARRQTTYPLCDYCQWPTVNPHPTCEEQFEDPEDHEVEEDEPDANYFNVAEDDDFDDEDDVISTTEVLSRAIARFGNTEEAHEAARLFPGDFI